MQFQVGAILAFPLDEKPLFGYTGVLRPVEMGTWLGQPSAARVVYISCSAGWPPRLPVYSME